MMKHEYGDPKSPIWLIGDSPPKNEKTREKLYYPFDPRHPAIHNIWTPIENKIQENLFLEGKRFNSKKMYIRNAISKPEYKDEARSKVWESHNLEYELKTLNKLIDENSVRVIFTFGAFAYEFTRRACNVSPKFAYNYWSTKKLSIAFKESLKSFDKDDPVIIPLLHVSIARGNFDKSHEYFCRSTGYRNYFDYTGLEISKILVKHFRSEDIWVKK